MYYGNKSKLNEKTEQVKKIEATWHGVCVFEIYSLYGSKC